MSMVDDLIEAVKEMRDHTIFYGPDGTECSTPDYFIWNVIQKLQKVENAQNPKPKFVPSPGFGMR